MSFDFIPADALSNSVFMAVVAAVLFMILLGCRRVSRKLSRQVAIFLTIWLIGFSLVVVSEVLKSHPFPGLPLFFLSINLGAIIFGLSRWGSELSTLPLKWLVLFQAFRLPLEIVLHLWSEQGTVPTEMSWSGQNFDVITGILALGALFNWENPYKFAWLFNIVGFGLLLNVIRVAIMSSPLPISWSLQNPLQLALYLPYALIGYVCVWAAFAGHIILTRALLSSKSSV